MKVNVTLTSWFIRFTDGKAALGLELEEGASAAKVASALGIPMDEIGFVAVNGKKEDIGCTLQDGDTLRIYPTIIGG